MTTTKLRAGEWVEIRSKEEILATLDTEAQLDRLPFMPEMFAYVGQRVRVVKRAHKTCDPPNGYAGRRMAAAVHLDGIRCDGSAHGNCQAGCLIFWKEAWLKPMENPGNDPPSEGAARSNSSTPCTVEDVRNATLLRSAASSSGEAAYSCQSTRIAQATTPLAWWDFRQYVEDYRSGNVRLKQMMAALLFTIYHAIASGGFGLGAAMRAAYDAFQKIRRGVPYPWRVGTIKNGQTTPSARLALRVGEWVRVKSFRKILDTLDADCKNRGMYFDGEEVPYCGGTYRVLTRVNQIIDEKSGRMLRLKNEAVVLDGVMCEARYSKCRRFCPRSIYPFWREIWLERAPAHPDGADKRSRDAALAR